MNDIKVQLQTKPGSFTEHHKTRSNGNGIDQTNGQFQSFGPSHQQSKRISVENKSGVFYEAGAGAEDDDQDRPKSSLQEHNAENLIPNRQS
jgi:hypothetical protein